jgi:hypothetical protein
MERMLSSTCVQMGLLVVLLGLLPFNTLALSRAHAQRRTARSYMSTDRPFSSSEARPNSLSPSHSSTSHNADLATRLRQEANRLRAEAHESELRLRLLQLQRARQQFQIAKANYSEVNAREEDFSDLLRFATARVREQDRMTEDALDMEMESVEKNPLHAQQPLQLQRTDVNTMRRANIDVRRTGTSTVNNIRAYGYAHAHTRNKHTTLFCMPVLIFPC